MGLRHKRHGYTIMTVELVWAYYVPVTDRVEAYASNEPKVFYPGRRVPLAKTEPSIMDGQSTE